MIIKTLRHLVFSCGLFLLSAQSVIAAVVLQYHHVDDSTPPITSISPELFERHLDYLDDNDYRVWPLTKLVDHLKAQRNIPDKTVVITFDDAYDSIYHAAYPLLKERSMPFTVFVASNPIDQKLASFMSWSQLREMQKHGATIANHTQSHTHLVRQESGEKSADWLARVKSEILLAEQRLKEELKSSPKLLSYPYGEYTSDIQAMVADLGYAAFGQQSGAINAELDLTALPRFPMTNHFGQMSQFELKVASLPLPAHSVAPSTRMIRGEELKNGLTIRFRDMIPNIACYFGGDAIETTQKDNVVRIAAMPKLPVGRSRINCTAPSSENGRFYWFSHYWMKPKPNGEWYPEP